MVRVPDPSHGGRRSDASGELPDAALLPRVSSAAKSTTRTGLLGTSRPRHAWSVLCDSHRTPPPCQGRMEGALGVRNLWRLRRSLARRRTSRDGTTSRLQLGACHSRCSTAHRLWTHTSPGTSSRDCRAVLVRLRRNRQLPGGAAFAGPFPTGVMPRSR